MSRLRRYYNNGTIFFVTSVTYERRQILVDHADLLHKAIKYTEEKQHFDLIAWAILPDHFHFILDVGEGNLTDIAKSLKQSFAFMYRKRIGVRTGRIWQYRFWDHLIRNQEDMNSHIDYIHHNAVKHGLTSTPMSYPHSSFVEYLDNGYYGEGWGHIGDQSSLNDFGE